MPSLVLLLSIVLSLLCEETSEEIDAIQNPNMRDVCDGYGGGLVLVLEGYDVHSS